MKHLKLRIEPVPPRDVIAQSAAYDRAIQSALDDAAKEAVRLLEKTTRTWRTQVSFTTRRAKYGRGVYSRSQVWGWVDRGTRSHVIKPRGPWLLRFRVGGRPKTRPRYLTSYAGSPGTEWRAAQSVNHPGTKPRQFSARAKEEIDRFLPKAMRARIAEAHSRRRR